MRIIFFLTIASLTACTTAQAPASRGTSPLISSTGQTIGSIRATQTADGIAFSVEASGLPPGVHGIHVHPIGRCDPPDFASAGTHWNPGNKQHGLNNPQGPHAGDMPNVTASADGVVNQTVVLPHATLAELLDADGASVLIHANADDYVSQPSGNSGAKIACAIIR